jgi:hypothetical protein
MRQFGVLDETTWPSEVPPGFGEDEVTEVCSRFKLPCVLTVNAFRDYVDNGGRRMPADLPLDPYAAAAAAVFVTPPPPTVRDRSVAAAEVLPERVGGVAHRC